MSNLQLYAAELAKSDAEENLAGQIRQSMLAGLCACEPLRQHKFFPGKKWAFDFAWPERMVAVEVDGGVFSGGRHTRGAGYTADCVKLNEATCAGWAVLRVTTAQVESGQAIGWVESLVKR